MRSMAFIQARAEFIGIAIRHATLWITGAGVSSSG